MNILSLRSPHLILAGVNALDRLGGEVKGTAKALLVTDKGVMGSGVGEKVAAVLKKEGLSVDVFDGVIPDPDIACAEACAAVARAGKYDCIVGVGGGSPMDIAAISSVMSANPGPVKDYLGINLAKHPGPPTILIPTTAGTGAEVTPNAVLTDTDEKVKKAMVSPYILPRVAIIDPMLHLSMPARVTAFSGMDALTHAVEAFTSTNATVITDIFAREAIKLIGKSLRTAVAKGSNLEARYDMALGSLFAGIALANAGVGAVHALAYPLGGEFNVPHGIANGLLLGFTMEFNVPGHIKKFAKVGKLMGEKSDGLSKLDRAYAAAEAVNRLARDVGIPKLGELKIPRDAVSRMAKAAVNITRLMNNNPRAMAAADAEKIYENAF